MRIALYRKYRPGKFAEVVGQEYIKATLLNEVKTDQIAHAYVFAGPKGTGKTSMARILAKSVNCLDNQAGEPCGKCVMCQAYDKGQMFDLIEIDAASHTGVENIRELISAIGLAPAQGKYKIYVIDEAHMLSDSAFNALLKTLEEPPSHAIFVLATTESHKFPATILSRCQRFDFRYLAIKNIADWLKIVAKHEELKLSDSVIEFLAEQAGGSMRDGLSLLEQVAQMGSDVTRDQLMKWLGFVDWEAVYQLTELTAKGEAKAAVGLINQVYYDGYDLVRLASAWVMLVRQLLVVKLGNQDLLDLNKERVGKLIQLSDQLELADLIWWLGALLTAANSVKTAALPQAPLEILAVESAQKLARKPATPPAVEKPAANRDDDQPMPPAAKSAVKPQPASQVALDWPKVVQAVRATSPTFAAVLALAKYDFVDGELTLCFPLEFYKEMAEQAPNRRILSEALQQTNVECTIRYLVDKSLKPGSSGVAIDEVMQIFGGA
ncbi:MAG: DNA polymerase III subunit gamma/tau [bacterium]